MTIPLHPAAEPRGVDAHRRVLLTDIYGAVVPEDALRLDHYLRRGRRPLRDPDQPHRVLTVDLATAAEKFGTDLAGTDRHIHHLHATGGLSLERGGALTLEHARTDE